MTTIPFAQRISCTIEEACQATGLGRTKLYEEMDAGRVETTAVGRRRLVLVRSLLHLIDPPRSPAGHSPAGEMAAA
jgi:excisionase family DNA binding protein